MQAQATLIKVAGVSHELSKALTDANTRPGGVNGPDISRARVWLDKIKATSREILEILNQCAISCSTPDEQLEGWISANGPTICLFALNEMKRIIQTDRPGRTLWGFASPSISFSPVGTDDRIRECIKVLHNHREHFDYLLAPGVWYQKMDRFQHMGTASLVSVQFNTSVNSSSGKDAIHEKQSMPLATGTARWDDSYSSSSSFPKTAVDVFVEEKIDRPRTVNQSDGPSSIQNLLHHARLNTMAIEFHRNNLPGCVSHEMGVIEKKEPKDWIDPEKLDIILQWFEAFRSFEKHRATVLQRQPDTCTWLLETNEYKEWLAGNYPLLWLQGKAGCGKSVLVASVIEHLEKTFVAVPLAFFYFDFGKERFMDATEAIRSLLYQLLDQYRHGKVKLGTAQVVDELVEEKHKGDTALRDITSLSSLVSRVAGQFHHQPLVVIDALDECKDLDRLLWALLELKAKGTLRLFVSSRPDQVIKHKLSGLPYVSVDEMAKVLSADIALHVNREIDSHLRLGLLDPELKRKVRSMLCQKAEGMFRWVQCQLDALKACVTLQEFQEALDNLPRGLDATYERILLGIARRSPEAKITQRALSWLITASRPLALNEIVDALSVDLRRQTLDRRIAPMHKYALLDALGSLVVHNEKTDTISLSHFSVKEYLTSEPTRTKLPAYHINLRKAHMQVFRLCMCYLAVSLDGHSDNDESLGEPPARNTATSLPARPLLDYIFSCGFDHLTHLDPTDDAVLDSLKRVQSAIWKHPLEWTHVCTLASLYHPYKSWLTPEHDFVVCILITMFPEPFLRAFLSRSPSESKNHLNPLVHAAHLDKVDHARTLLSYGVDVNRGGQAGPRCIPAPLPLEVAIRRKNDMMVELFLKEGSAAVPESVYRNISYHDSSACIVLRLLQADEFAEWATKVKDSWNLLRRRHQAPEDELLVMIRRMVQVGHDLPSFSSESALDLLLLVASAMSKGYLSVLEYLFSMNAPLPSGIFADSKMQPLIREFTLRGIDVNFIAASGDHVLHQVLGYQCWLHSYRPRDCWVLGCMCSEWRTTLLMSLGRESERTLIKILTMSRKLNSTLSTADISTPGIQEILSQLKGITSASGKLLQEINKMFLDGSKLSHHSQDWLSGEEPKSCVETLQEMIKLLFPDEFEEMASSEGRCGHVDQPLLSEDKINDVILLFDEKQCHFVFLLATDAIGESEVDPQKTDSDLLEDVFFEPASIRPLSISPCSMAHWLEEPSRKAPILQDTDLEVDVLFAGATGVGKSSLINMAMGIPDHSQAAARVSDGLHQCTLHTTFYPCVLTAGIRCSLWDTRALDARDRGWFTKTVGRIRASKLAYQLDEIHSHRIKLHTPILAWCIDYARVDVPNHWQAFHSVYAECEQKEAIVVVVTRIPPNATGWMTRCSDQLEKLGLGQGSNTHSIPLLGVREYHNGCSPEYVEDSRALADFISQRAKTLSSMRRWFGGFGSL